MSAIEPSMRTRETPLEECASDECRLPKMHEALCSGFLPIHILYTNWKGRQDKRKLSPTGNVEHKATEWHKLPQWLFEAIDCEDGKLKWFSIKDVNAGRENLEIGIRLRWTHG